MAAVLIHSLVRTQLFPRATVRVQGSSCCPGPSETGEVLRGFPCLLEILTPTQGCLVALAPSIHPRVGYLVLEVLLTRSWGAPCSLLHCVPQMLCLYSSEDLGFQNQSQEVSLLCLPCILGLCLCLLPLGNQHRTAWVGKRAENKYWRELLVFQNCLPHGGFSLPGLGLAVKL